MKQQLKQMIQKIITFITKTLPEFIKKAVNKIRSLFKKRSEPIEVEVSGLSVTQEKEVDAILTKVNKAIMVKDMANVNIATPNGNKTSGETEK